MPYRTDAFYSPHSRLGWRGTGTTPGCRLGRPEDTAFAAKRDSSREPPGSPRRRHEAAAPQL